MLPITINRRHFYVIDYTIYLCGALCSVYSSQLKVRIKCTSILHRSRERISTLNGSATLHILYCPNTEHTHAHTIRWVINELHVIYFFLCEQFYSFSFIYFSALYIMCNVQCSSHFFFCILFYGYWILIRISLIRFINIL